VDFRVDCWIEFWRTLEREKEECRETFLQRLEKDLELDQWWCKKDSRIFNWSKEYKVRGATLFVILNCMIYVVCCMIG